MVGADEVRTALRTHWHRAADECSPLPGGAPFAVWLIALADARYVVKAVAAERRRRFEAGLAAAGRLAAAGIAAGAPVRAVDGALSVVSGRVAMALLHHVPGRPLDPDNPLDHQWWGDALAAAHHALVGFSHPAVNRLQLIRPDATHLAVADWLRPAVVAALEAVAKLSVTDQLTYGVLHGDPAPDVFRLDIGTGRTGVIGWGAAGTGPLVYDLASAVMHAGGPRLSAELLDGYVSAGPVPREEVEAALPTMLRFRYAVQADRFASRIWTDGCADVADWAQNWAGLRYTREMLDQ